MKSEEYIKLAMRTESQEQYAKVTVYLEGQLASRSQPQRLLHGALGLASELGELSNAHAAVNTCEEIGDMLWYAAIIADAIGMTQFKAYLPNGGNHRRREIEEVVAEICDHVKKHVFYSQPLESDAMMDLLYELYFYLMLRSDWELEHVMEANIIKLQKRYPEKFTTELAAEENRNREEEAKAIGAML